MMIRSVRIRLLPTEEQERKMRRTAGAVRYAYNWGLARREEIYRETGKGVHCREVRNEFTRLKKTEEYAWLREISSKAVAQAFEHLQSAYDNHFKHGTSKPKFKSKKRTKPSFYARYDGLNFNKERQEVNLERIGKVKYRTNQDFPILSKYVRPTVTFDGKYWYLGFGWEQEQKRVELEPISIGIDLGIKELATVSALDDPIKNINRTPQVKKLEKRLRRLQRQLSRKYDMNKTVEGGRITYNKTKNIIKLEREIKLIFRRLTNIRDNHIHQATARIVKLKPSRVVMEDMKVTWMFKNKNLALAVSKQKLDEFKRQMEYKCETYGIELVLADRFFPSSKTCSSCGHVKQNLKLSERTYRCSECGLVMDRDKNASINLAKYNLPSGLTVPHSNEAVNM